MSDTAIFVIGLFVTALCSGFVAFSVYEVRRLYADAARSPEPSDENSPDGR